jgi:precorrin-4/cobalt-precorrin-4 C11-methyltransferase
MKVYFIGAGPGDPELITVRGQKLVARCPMILYTGSLVPRAVLAQARSDARIVDTASLTLEQIVDLMKEAQAQDLDVARVHTGDPLIYGSTAEQMRCLRGLGIAYEVVPGVSSYAAAAAAIEQELTLPELSQTIIITRCEGRTPMPSREKLEDLARHQATLVLFLSITMIRKISRQLGPIYGEDCPVVVVYKASLPEQQIIRGTLADITRKVTEAKVTSQSIILVGRVLGAEDFAVSRLYAADFSHGFRQAQPQGPL